MIDTQYLDTILYLQCCHLEVHQRITLPCTKSISCIAQLASPPSDHNKPTQFSRNNIAALMFHTKVLLFKIYIPDLITCERGSRQEELVYVLCKQQGSDINAINAKFRGKRREKKRIKEGKKKDRKKCKIQEKRKKRKRKGKRECYNRNKRKTKISSRGGWEVEQWSDNRTPSLSMNQSSLGACMIIWYQWTHYVMYVLDVCYMCVS